MQFGHVRRTPVIRTEGILEEPMCAAAYVIYDYFKTMTTKEIMHSNLLVYILDCGGGTVDVSILTVRGLVFTMLATHGMHTIILFFK